ncbi:threonine-phosphate decarboxylase CobD [Candidatus Bathycorpusculum sp.]|jgi:threonine-phosphate decarboxylase|uniref:threonine-phosphate decarboxylase CobD n=1 Tax=Candidatus Bathycorpusculum sp. TaxID=2994959 RepID=UPI0028267146|nr:threonine-phosphate decarboxylase CobD [Candidatus Termitimicrobium sp.]MCL2432062.1 threonine-phosphate decarboxylase CobD [Candidatus Termitimicrobium sp.]MDR0471567.1 threonine-phosphate decarboxylase CobD [Nitrososphaerota archaeon]
MKSIESLTKDNIKNLAPCRHGAEVHGAAQESGYSIREILDFSSSVNPLGPSKKALDAIQSAFAEIITYPDTNSTMLRQTIAGQFSGVTKDNIVVGNGSTELMYLFAEAFLKRGEKALMAAPTFGEYERAVRKTGESVKFMRLDKSFQIDVDAFKREMTGCKLIFICNPNNPTSKLIPKDSLASIIDSALSQDILVFLDEDFLEFVDDEKNHSMIPKICKYPNLFVLRSFTKIFGLTGLRVGYGVTNKEIAEVLHCAKIPWNVNCLAQAAATVAIKDSAHLQVTLELIKKEKAWLQTKLSNIASFSFSPPDANFFFIDIEKTGLTANALKHRMLRQGILIRDCSNFVGLNEFYIRVAVKTHEENTRLIEAFKNALNPV